jgi:hypothetical protein
MCQPAPLTHRNAVTRSCVRSHLHMQQGTCHATTKPSAIPSASDVLQSIYSYTSYTHILIYSYTHILIYSYTYMTLDGQHSPTLTLAQGSVVPWGTGRGTTPQPFPTALTKDMPQSVTVAVIDAMQAWPRTHPRYMTLVGTTVFSCSPTPAACQVRNHSLNPSLEPPLPMHPHPD